MSEVPSVDRFPDLETDNQKRRIAAQHLAALTLQITQLTDDFAHVERMPRLSDSRRETDVEHSFNLSLLAPEIAVKLDIGLDVAKVRTFALVHDLVEVKAGDVATFDLTPEQMKLKEEREHAAKLELLAELPPELAAALDEYERQDTREARFVRAVDKLMPLAVDKIGDGVRLLREDYGVDSTEKLIAAHDRLHGQLVIRFGNEFPEIVDVYAILSEIVEEKFRESEDQMTHQERLRGPSEIELKYLVDLDNLPADINLAEVKKSHLRQGYVAVGADGSETRVRSFDDNRFELTVKSPGMIERQEQTATISKDMFDSLWEQTEGRQIQKVRHYIPLGDNTIELDIYEGDLSGLVTAEVEFSGRPAEAMVRLETFVPPAWFGEDISKDPRYKNHNLSQGLPGEPHSMDDIKY